MWGTEPRASRLVFHPPRWLQMKDSYSLAAASFPRTHKSLAYRKAVLRYSLRQTHVADLQCPWHANLCPCIDVARVRNAFRRLVIQSERACYAGNAVARINGDWSSWSWIERSDVRLLRRKSAIQSGCNAVGSLGKRARLGS